MARKLRIECEQRARAGSVLKDMRTGVQAFFLRGEAVTLELALFANGRMLTKAEITSVRVRWLTGATVLSTTTVSPAALSGSLTVQQWRQGAAALALVSFSTAATASLPAGMLTLEVTATVSGGMSVYASGLVESVTSPALTEGTPPAPGPPAAYTKAETDSLLAAAEAQREDLESRVGELEENTELPWLIIGAGDSTMAQNFWVDSTETPYLPADQENPDVWWCIVKRRMLAINPNMKFVNLAVPGRRLDQIRDTFIAEAAPHAPRPGQRAMLILCAGHNDVSQDQNIPNSNFYAQQIRGYAEDMGITETVYMPCHWTANGPNGAAKSSQLSALALADAANWTHVIARGLCPGYNNSEDGAHQTRDGHLVDAERVLTQVFNVTGRDIFKDSFLTCGRGGDFASVDAAIKFRTACRLDSIAKYPVNHYKVVGEVHWKFPAGGVYGDGRWETTGDSPPLHIEIAENAALNIQRNRIDYRTTDAASKPQRVEIFGAGTLVQLNLAGINDFGDVVFRAACEVMSFPTGIGFFGANRRYACRRLYAGPEYVPNPELGAALFADGSNHLTVESGTNVIQQYNNFVMLSTILATVRGIVIMAGCTIQRNDGGALEHNNGIGRVCFYGPSFVTNLTMASGGAGHTWEGTMPTLLAAGDTFY